MRAAPLPFLALALVGCGAGSSMTDAVAFQAKAAAPEVRAAAREAPVASPRMVVRNAGIRLRVSEIGKAEERIGDLARAAGGYVEASQGDGLSGPSPTLGVTLRVPEARFDGLVAGIEGLGTRLSKTIGTEDVTAQAVDLDARLRSLRVQEEAYRAILRNARRIGDVLEVQEKLTGVRTLIEEIVAQRRGLADQAAMSKIVVDLTQSARAAAPAPEPDWIAQTWGDATAALRSVGRGFASAGLWGVALLPIWLPLGLAGFLLRRMRRPSSGR